MQNFPSWTKLYRTKKSIGEFVRQSTILSTSLATINCSPGSSFEDCVFFEKSCRRFDSFCPLNVIGSCNNVFSPFVVAPSIRRETTTSFMGKWRRLRSRRIRKRLVEWWCRTRLSQWWPWFGNRNTPENRDISTSKTDTRSSIQCSLSNNNESLRRLRLVF